MNPATPPTLPTARLSLASKIFTISFLSIHAPLIVLLAFLLTGGEPDAASVVSLLLTATVLGTAFCLFTLWRLLRPLRSLAVAVAN